ncbi:MAG: Rrf2 family transcriptional regulator [Treponema sp.]|jgi:DNA-binding IscR family transcriptional regulator|nr:Rrf2 family transcriptional regulator [Treponema sp.]
MKNSTRFAVAIHTLLIFALDGKNQGRDKVSARHVALSVNTNPVVIRRIMGLLKKSGLLIVRPGVTGAFLSRKPRDISLRDIYLAVKTPKDNIFKLHDKTSPTCPVGSKINIILKKKLAVVEKKVENELARIRLSDIIDSVVKFGNEAAA